MTDPEPGLTKGIMAATGHLQGPVAKATQQKAPSQTRSTSNSRGTPTSVDQTKHNEQVLDHKLIIVSSSDLAIHIAARMDAQQIPAIFNAGTLKNFRGEMDVSTGANQGCLHRLLGQPYGLQFHP